MLSDSEFKTIVASYRDEAAPAIEFAPAVEKLVDADYCRRLCDFLHRDGKCWERRRAVDTLYRQLPHCRGLYMFVWRPEVRFEVASNGVERPFWILYVGKAGSGQANTDTLRDRYQTEYRKYVGRDASVLWAKTTPQCRAQRLERYLTLRPMEYWFLDLDDTDPSEITRLEKQLIKLLRPPLNCFGSPGIGIRKRTS